jgi:pimeloyl-ACP methyl ester carboxylesterase
VVGLQSGEGMAEPSITKRLVYHVGGFDPTEPRAVHQRFARELNRFRTTWSVAADISEPVINEDTASWHVASSGPNWRVETEYRLLRWDDVIKTVERQLMWRRVPTALLAFADFVASGALWGYFRFNWRYAGFFLYPFLLFAILAGVAFAAGALANDLARSALVGWGVGLAALALLMIWPARQFYLPLLFDDWIFSRSYIRQREAVLDARLDRVARELVARARAGDVDEILVIGHSLGAVLAVDLLDRALRLDRGLGKGCTRLALASVGSSLLKIGLHGGATRFRAAVARVASASQVFWAEYQALTDVMNFYKTNPVAAMGLEVPGRPVVRVARIRRMVQPARYKRMRRNLFKVHCQFVNGNDQRAAYDYFMLLCGPLSVERQVGYAEGAVAAIGEDGALREDAVPPFLESTLEMIR